jgi:hypothetical protein
MNWYKSGLFGSGVALACLSFASIVCRSESAICDRVGRAFDTLNAPARLLVDPLLHQVGYLLGKRQLGPDLVAAPPGVATTLQVLAGAAFLAYWFGIGVALYYGWSVLRRKYRASPSE